jgi:hypothetical protein
LIALCERFQGYALKLEDEKLENYCRAKASLQKSVMKEEQTLDTDLHH